MSLQTVNGPIMSGLVWIKTVDTDGIPDIIFSNKLVQKNEKS